MLKYVGHYGFSVSLLYVSTANSILHMNHVLDDVMNAFHSVSFPFHYSIFLQDSTTLLVIHCFFLIYNTYFSYCGCIIGAMRTHYILHTVMDYSHNAGYSQNMDNMCS